MAKRRGSPYVAGRSPYWLKLRFDHRQECAVIGFIPLKGSAEGMGAWCWRSSTMASLSTPAVSEPVSPTPIGARGRKSSRAT